MSERNSQPGTRPPAQARISTGISGFDTMTSGGLPRGRITAIAGSAGAGKTVFALQALVHGIRNQDAAGIFVAFEESPDSIVHHARGFSWNPCSLVGDQLILVDGRWQMDDIQSGNFDISGLLSAVEGLARQRETGFLVLDGIDVLLAMLPDAMDPRRELYRLQSWAEALGLTTLVTIKSPGILGSAMGRFEDMATYMADCVVVLEHKVLDTISCRNLIIQKYRGCGHVQNQVPYVIDSQGIELETVDTYSGGYRVFTERVASGFEDLDQMLRGGIYRGSTTLMSGSPGTSKTTLSAKIVETACQRGEKALFICFDEAPDEIVRNVSSVGIKLAKHVRSRRLLMDGLVARSSSADRLASRILMMMGEHQPQYLVLDPVSALATTSDEYLAHNAIRLVVQECKRAGITIIFTSLLEHISGDLEISKAHISTLCDNWIHLSYVINGGERNRALTIVKSRGTGHSNQVRELILDDRGLHLKPVYTEQGEVLMGTLRWQREERNRKEERQQELAREQRYRETRREVEGLSARIASLQRELQEKHQDLDHLDAENVAGHREEQGRRLRLGEIREGSSPADKDKATAGKGSASKKPATRGAKTPAKPPSGTRGKVK